VADNLFELGQFSGLRLIDLRFPPSFAFRGPAFGIARTRRVARVAQGPLVGTIVKPSVGLPPEATAATVRALCAGGIGFIKDDSYRPTGLAARSTSASAMSWQSSASTPSEPARRSCTRSISPTIRRDAPPP
jgi:hypothetical protein